MTDRYLLATDGEQATRSLVRYLAARFDPGEVRIEVICVADDSRVLPYLMAGEAGTGGIDPSTVQDQLEERAETICVEAVDQLEDRGFEATSTVRFGRPGPEICEAAETEDFNAILISRRSHTAVGEILLGSVSQYVVHHADTPVTLVPLSED